MAVQVFRYPDRVEDVPRVLDLTNVVRDHDAIDHDLPFLRRQSHFGHLLRTSSTARHGKSQGPVTAPFTAPLEGPTYPVVGFER